MSSVAGYTLFRWASICSSGFISNVAAAAVVLFGFYREEGKWAKRNEISNLWMKEWKPIKLIRYLYMLWSEEKLPVEVRFLNQIWISNANLGMKKCILRIIPTFHYSSKKKKSEESCQMYIPTSPEHLFNPTPKRAKFFSISQPIAPQPTIKTRHLCSVKHSDSPIQALNASYRSPLQSQVKNTI